MGEPLINDGVPLGESPPQYLLDLRLVYNGVVKSPAQRKLKELWDREPEKFLARWAAAEKEYRVWKGGVGHASAPESSGPVEDPGTDRAVELIDRLLSEAGDAVSG